MSKEEEDLFRDEIEEMEMETKIFCVMQSETVVIRRTFTTISCCSQIYLVSKLALHKPNYFDTIGIAVETVCFVLSVLAIWVSFYMCGKQQQQILFSSRIWSIVCGLFIFFAMANWYYMMWVCEFSREIVGPSWSSMSSNLFTSEMDCLADSRVPGFFVLMLQTSGIAVLAPLSGIDWRVGTGSFGCGLNLVTPTGRPPICSLWLILSLFGLLNDRARRERLGVLKTREKVKLEVQFSPKWNFSLPHSTYFKYIVLTAEKEYRVKEAKLSPSAPTEVHLS